MGPECPPKIKAPGGQTKNYNQPIYFAFILSEVWNICNQNFVYMSKHLEILIFDQ